MKDLGDLRCFLGIKIDRDEDGMFLSQAVYLKNPLARFKMKGCNPIKTLMQVNPFNDGEDSIESTIEVKPYRELTGCLMFIMLNTRPDLSAAVNCYSRFQGNVRKPLARSQTNTQIRKRTIDIGLYLIIIHSIL